METKFKFEKLIIWQRAMDLAEEVNLMIDNFPPKERYNLSSQSLRAIDSVALNISEGAIVQSGPEFKRFLGYSIRSLAELVTCLHKAKRRKYIDEEQFHKHYLEAFNLLNMTIGFRNKVK